MEHGFRLFPDQASTVAPRVDALYGYLLGVAVVFTLLIFFAIVFLALYYRRAAGRHRPGAHHGKLWMLETAKFSIRKAAARSTSCTFRSAGRSCCG
jgi:heme/copper-type cytochrome/quinol oxidase subunit 2